jgi:hypothetical protein
MLDAVTDWFKYVWTMIVFNYEKIKALGWEKFLEYRSVHNNRPLLTEETIMLPFDEDIRHKKWVVIKDTGQIAVIDHMKSDGKLGVRPVDPLTAAYLPNTSKHWSWDDRIRIPHELALPPGKVRVASEDEIPHIVRK